MLSETEHEIVLRHACVHRERLHLARDVHSLCARRLEVSGPSAPSILKPMQQLAAWQDKLQQQLQVQYILWIAQ